MTVLPTSSGHQDIGAAALPLALALAASMAISGCSATPTPIVDLPPPVTVAANAGATIDAAAPTAPAGAQAAGASASVAGLQAALAARGYDALQAMMGDAFVLGLYRSEGMTLDPAAARSALETQYLPASDHTVEATDDRNAFPAIDPPLETMFDPALIVHQLLFSRGWGADGLGEAVLVLAERADGTVYWHGMVLAPAGFGGAGGDAAGTPVHGNGFTVDAPSGWTATESGGGVILTSFSMDTAGHGGLGAGQTKIDVLELVADPAPATLEDAAAAVKAGDPSAGWAQGRVVTVGGLSGLYLKSAQTTAMVIDLGGTFLVASCYGDGCSAGGAFDAVVRSVRLGSE